MILDGFKEYCLQKENDEALVEQIIEHVTNFQNYLEKSNRDIVSADRSSINDYAKLLIEAKKNTKETFYALIRYSFYSKNKKMLIALYELLDGSEVLTNLQQQAKEILGDKETKELFRDITMPTLGTPPEQKPSITKEIIERLMDKCNHETTHQILISNLHGIPKENYLKERELFLEAGNIDDYLKIRRANFIRKLEEHRDKMTLFFTQEINQKVINFIKLNPRIEGGERKGNILFMEKIPYMTIKFLEAADKNERKYYYCHCSWVREALKKDEISIPSRFCDCSAGFYKNQWEAIIERQVEVETIESILQGDKRCLFAIHLPDAVINKTKDDKNK